MTIDSPVTSARPNPVMLRTMKTLSIAEILCSVNMLRLTAGAPRGYAAAFQGGFLDAVDPATLLERRELGRHRDRGVTPRARSDGEAHHRLPQRFDVRLRPASCRPREEIL